MNRSGQFDGAAAREALEQLRQARSGVIVVSDGARDLRLTLSPEEISLEALGFVLQGGEPRDLVREFLCALFWNDPSYLLEPPRPVAARGETSTIRVQEQVSQLLAELGRGIKELGELHRRVHGLEAQISVRGEPPESGPDDPPRLLFDALLPHGERGECLGTALEQLPLDPLDAAWAVADLLDSERATVRATPLPTLLRRARQLEPLLDEGLVPGLRRLHAARTLVRVDRRRAATLHRQAADELLGGERAALAVDALRAGLALHADDLAARELLVTALERDERKAEARLLREELLELYLRCALPARARAHLEALDQGAPEHKLRLLTCLLGTRDFAGAEELAQRLAPSLPPRERLALPFQFADAGAPAECVGRVTALAGLGRWRRRRQLLWAVALLLLLASAVAVGEVRLRLQFRQATTLARSDLGVGAWEEAARRWDGLRGQGQRLAVSSWPAALRERTCLSRVAQELAGIEELRADQAALAGKEAELAWRRSGDTRAARGRLEGLLGQLRSPAGRQALQRELDQLDAYRREVQGRVQRLRELVTGSRLDQAVAQAQAIRAEHQDARDLWEGESVRLRVALRPATGARLFVDGQAVPAVNKADAEWEVSVPIDGSRGPPLRAEGDHAVPRELRVSFSDTMVEPTVWVRLYAVARLVRGDPPERGSEPGLFVYDDTAELLASLGPGAELLSSDLRATLAPALDPVLEGTTLRLSVVLRGEGRQRRSYLQAIDLYLQDTSRNGAAEPRRVDMGRVSRSLTRAEDGPWRLAGLECLGSEDLPYLLAVLEETARDMRAELEGENR